MKCECGGETQIKDSRKMEEGVWRKRVCVLCGAMFTTLEQRCTTVANPHSTKRHHLPAVVAPDVPAVQHPQPENKRAVAARTPDVWKKIDQPAAPRPGRKALPKPAAPRPARQAPATIAPRTDLSYPAAKAVDRNEPAARDRIEDMKFEREQKDYGWD